MHFVASSPKSSLFASLARQSKQLSGKGARLTLVSCMNRAWHWRECRTHFRAHAHPLADELRAQPLMLTAKEKIHREKMISRRVIAIRTIRMSVARRSQRRTTEATARELVRA